MVVAILGTTISPYLFFWQAAQEVEDTKAEPTRTATAAGAPGRGRERWPVSISTPWSAWASRTSSPWRS